MVRVFSFLTLALVAVCLVISVTIAMADDTPPAPQPNPADLEAIQPDERLFDESLAAVDDVYEFDFTVTVGNDDNPEIVTHSDILEI